MSERPAQVHGGAAGRGVAIKTAMFLLAAVVLTCPYPFYVPYWLVGASLVMELVLAAKLSATAAVLAKEVSAPVVGVNSGFYMAADFTDENGCE